MAYCVGLLAELVGFSIEVKPRGLSHSCDSGRGLRYHRCRRPGLNLYYVPVNYIISPVSERYAKNAGAVFSLKYHLVWCPKYRRPVLVKPVDRRRKALRPQKAKELGMAVHEREVMPDHVHWFVESDPTLCVAEIVNRRKGFPSHPLRQEFAFLRSRLPTWWSRSYYAGSVGSVSEAVVRQYNESQKGK